MKRTWIMAAAVAAALLPQTTAAETKLVFNTFVPRAHQVFSGVWEPWARNVETATQGRVKIEFSAASLGPVPRQFDMVQKGIADIVFDQPVFNAKRFVLPSIAELPMVGLSSEAASVALWRTHEKYFAPANEYAGVKLLGYLVIGPAHIWTVSHPVKTLADVRNLKIRATSRYVKPVMDALGAALVAVPGPNAHELISKGTVDGTAFSISDIYNFRVDGFLKHALVVPGGLYSAAFAMLLNEGKWNAIDKADQAAVAKASGEALARLAGSWDAADKRAWEQVRKAGTQVAFLDRQAQAALEAQLAPLADEWIKDAAAKGVDGKAALAYFRAQVAAEARNHWRPAP